MAAPGLPPHVEENLQVREREREGGGGGRGRLTHSRERVRERVSVDTHTQHSCMHTLTHAHVNTCIYVKT